MCQVSNLIGIGGHGRTGAYVVPVGLWGLPTAEVAQGPGGVAEHAQLTAIVDEVQERAQGTSTQHEVAAVRAVTGNVTQSPDGLFTDIRLGAG